MLLAELTILLKLDTIGIVLLVLHIVVVTLLALGTSQGYSISHNRPPVIFSVLEKTPLYKWCYSSLPLLQGDVKHF
jgi:hypothetical protein